MDLCSRLPILPPRQRPPRRAWCSQFIPGVPEHEEATRLLVFRCDPPAHLRGDRPCRTSADEQRAAERAERERAERARPKSDAEQAAYWTAWWYGRVP